MLEALLQLCQLVWGAHQGRRSNSGSVAIPVPAAPRRPAVGGGANPPPAAAGPTTTPPAAGPTASAATTATVTATNR